MKPGLLAHSPPAAHDAHDGFSSAQAMSVRRSAAELLAARARPMSADGLRAPRLHTFSGLRIPAWNADHRVLGPHSIAVVLSLMVRLGHAQSPRAAAPSPEQEAHFDEYKKKRGMSRFGSWAPGKLFDSALQKAVGKALNAVEAMVVIEDPYMPKCFGLRDLATATKKQLWVEVKDALNDMINESISSADADYRHMRLRNWAAYPHLWPANRCLPNPYNWFRAHFLYAIFPADASRWKMLRDPFAVVIILLSLCPLYAVSVWMFILLFFLIDKRDEHQLVGYILKFRRRSSSPSGCTTSSSSP